MQARLHRTIHRMATTLVVLLAPVAALADPSDHGGPRGREFGRDRGHFEGDFRRDRRDAQRGHTVQALPRHYDIAVHNGLRFYFGGGLWYSHDRPGRYVVVAPPLGIIVPLLPPFYTTVRFGPTPYYYANNIYYQQVHQGYMVVAPPVSVAATAPQAPVAPVAPRAPAPEEFFVYPREGQTLAQQAADREQCNEWATGQTGHDPRFDLPANDDMAPRKKADYRRALDACMDGRGYTMK